MATRTPLRRVQIVHVPRRFTAPRGPASVIASEKLNPVSMTVRVQNYRSLKDARLEIKTGLNVLIGPNGAGKSNVIHALVLLRDILTEGVGQALALSGGVERTFRRRAKSMTFTVSLSLGSRKVRSGSEEFFANWTLDLLCDRKTGLAHISKEHFSIETASKKRLLSANRVRKQGGTERRSHALDKSRYFVSSSFAVYGEADAGTRKAKIIGAAERWLQRAVKLSAGKHDQSMLVHFQTIDQGLLRLVEMLRGVNDYNFLPEDIRASTPRLPYTSLGQTGHGLAELLFALEENAYERIQSVNLQLLYDRHLPYFYSELYPQRWIDRESLSGALDQINEGLRNGVPSLAGVRTERDASTGRRVLRLKSEAGEDFSAAEVSDGTLKWLAILAALSTQQATVFVLEEPENFLHPWMQHALLRLARSQALSRGGAFIITTHSTSLLSACQPTEVITVESFGGNTRVRRLRSLREVQRLMTTAAMSLGDLWVDGSLGAVPNG